MWLGFDPGKPGDRPRVGRGTTQRPIFEPPPVVNGSPALGPRPSRYDLLFCEDWFGAFRKLVDENVMDQGGQLVDLEQNRRLGAVLTLVGAQ